MRNTRIGVKNPLERMNRRLGDLKKKKESIRSFHDLEDKTVEIN